MDRAAIAGINGFGSVAVVLEIIFELCHPKPQQQPRANCASQFLLMKIPIARGRPAHKSHAVQTPRGQLSFIADYL